MSFRTDMAMESKRMWEQSAEENTKLPGVVAKELSNHGISADFVEIVGREGAQALNKPLGKYYTVDLSSFVRKHSGAFRNTVMAFSEHLLSLLPTCKNVLIACLGNSSIAADAVGPETIKRLVVTRHLVQNKICPFQNFCQVSAVAPGVLGKTGIESLELIKGAAEKIRPDCILAVDALASCEPERLCMSVQLTDTGIMPGSGIGNHRLGFTEETLGVPVIAIGVPTMVDGATFLHLHGEKRGNLRSDLILTLRDMDLRVHELGELIGYGINLALHPQLTLDDIPGFLS